MSTFRVSHKSLLGSAALDATLPSWVAANGAILTSAPRAIADSLCLHFIKARQDEGQQVIVVELKHSIRNGYEDNPICQLQPLSNGSGVTFLPDDPDQLITLTSLLSLGCFSGVLITADRVSECRDHILAMVNASVDAGAYCVVSTHEETHDLDFYGAMINVTNSVELQDASGLPFGWRIDGLTQLNDASKSKIHFATLIQDNLDIHVPFDMVAAGLISGVLEQNDDGLITSNGKVFTKSFDEAVVRLRRIDVQARLKNAILFSKGSSI